MERGQAGRVVILPTNRSAIQGASIDVRLGNWFKIAQRTRLAVVDLGGSRPQGVASQIGYEEIFLEHGHPLTIHPGDFVLAITLEFFALPLNVMAFVEGRSLLGRAGLTVATASTVAPGFSGGIVLELSNTGMVPVQVRPGMDIAQVVLIGLTDDAPPYQGSSQGQIRP
jgi:dCTP deaminase